MQTVFGGDSPASTPAASAPMRLLLVRVWSTREGFRASARRVDEDEARLFTAAAPLTDYLAALAAESAPDPHHPRGTP